MKLLSKPIAAGPHAKGSIAMIAVVFLLVSFPEELEGTFIHISATGTPGNVLDGFAISRAQTGEYIRGSLRVLRLDKNFNMTPQEFEDHVKDHLPLEAGRKKLARLLRHDQY